MSISNEALSAAIDALDGQGINIGNNDALAALEAAAPHLIQAAKADAWDEGSQARWDYQWRDDIEPLTNPYR